MCINSSEQSLGSCTTINCSLHSFFFLKIGSRMGRKKKYYWIQNQRFKDSLSSAHLALMYIIKCFHFDLISAIDHISHYSLGGSVSSSLCGASHITWKPLRHTLDCLLCGLHKGLVMVDTKVIFGNHCPASTSSFSDPYFSLSCITLMVAFNTGERVLPSAISLCHPPLCLLNLIFSLFLLK